MFFFSNMFNEKYIYFVYFIIFLFLIFVLELPGPASVDHVFFSRLVVVLFTSESIEQCWRWSIHQGMKSIFSLCKHIWLDIVFKKSVSWSVSAEFIDSMCIASMWSIWVISHTITECKIYQKEPIQLQPFSFFYYRWDLCKELLKLYFSFSIFLQFSLRYRSAAFKQYFMR